MKKSYSYWFVVGVLFAVQLILLGMRYPAPLYSPADVIEAHSKLRCKSCHAPFKKIPSESCSEVKCHPEGKIGKKAAVTDLHNMAKGKDCLICHTDHKGLKGKITKAFNHDTLGTSSQCMECHKGPKDDLHLTATGNCGDCHTTKGWKPSTYNHEKYFFLDKDHKVACKKCHDTGSSKKYTCMNCHEHSSRGIVAEHREEGIREGIGRCLDCHRVNMGGRSYGADKTGEGGGMGEKKEDD